MGLKSNEPIIKLAKEIGGNAWDFLTSGAASSRGVYEAMEEGSKDLFKAIGQGHMREGAELAWKNVDPAKIAGS
mgnify:FL=1